MSAIRFEDVSYLPPGAGVRALDALTLEVGAGEVVALVGRSGAGKTTVLRLVNRLALPTAGRVLIDGRDTREWNPIELRRSIGYVIQDGGLFPHLTVTDNVAVVPRLREWPERRVADRVAEMLRLVGLSPREHGMRWPDQLSGGQRQRVGVARALAADPGLLLMDEPFGALDPLTRADLHTEFRALQRQVRKTVLLVTHDLGEALSLADRIAVLDAGRLVACASPADMVRSDDPLVRRLLESVLVRIEAGSDLRKTGGAERRM